MSGLPRGTYSSLGLMRQQFTTRRKSKMGACMPEEITRRDALLRILARVTEMSDKDLEDILVHAGDNVSVKN